MKRTLLMVAAGALSAALPRGAACGAEKAPVDPFAQTATTTAPAATAAPAAVAPKATTAGANANPFRSAAAPAATPARGSSAAAQKSKRALSDQALLDARRALAVGDIARAQQFLGESQQLQVAYDGPGDSPQRVAESIAQGQELNEARKSTNGGESWRQSYARFLLAQSDALLSWNDLETATRAANESAQLNPHYGATGLTPATVLRRIAERRQGTATAAAAGSAPAGTGAAAPSTIADAKSQTLTLMAKARVALQAGDLAAAEQLAGQASALNVPDSQFAPTEDRPGKLATDLVRARGESRTTELTAGSLPTTDTPGAVDYAQAAADVVPDIGALGSELPEAMPLPPPGAGPAGSPNDPMALLEAGEQALRAGDRAGALENFKAAYAHHKDMDVLAQQRLQGHLQMMQAASPGNSESVQAPAGELLDSAAAGQTVAARQLSANLGNRQSEARKLREKDPAGALRMLRESRTLVEESTLDDGFKRQLLSRVDMSLAETEKYITDHKSELELDAANKEVLDEIEREHAMKAQVQQKMAQMVDQFNKLIDEHRFAEAEQVANRLYAMAPDELVAQVINRQAKTIRANQWSDDIREQSADGVSGIMLGIRQDAADGLKGSSKDYDFGDRWADVKNRRGADVKSRRTIKELEIEQKLKTPVLPRYDQTPLTKVIEGLSQFAGVNIYLDPRGLEQEGVRSDAPITLNLGQEVSLKSALTLILEPLHLTYTIKDEVLKITSEQIRDGEVFNVVYSVGDLVIPIPNFVPNNNMGLQGLINDAYSAMGGAAGYGGGAPGPMAVVAGSQPGQASGPLPKTAMGQQMGFNPNSGMQGGGNNPMMSSGPGSLGGGAQADFDSLIDLIVSTVEHESWQENGTGEGEIQPFPTNLSLVISQTQRVHEQIADLLEQLRRLQDLQVTIEVRFIRLTDSFFERIGVDFDFNIEDSTYLAQANGNNTQQALTPGSLFEPRRASATVGIDTPGPGFPFPNYTVDLDIPFRQGSFGLAQPQFGTPTGDAGGRFGFAILSDIEAFFLIEAAQGDRRANVLQAPKVTLFNGQQAVVVDSSFVPFVISVIPVVGDFAAAQQPVIVVLSEGTMMTVQAVVSDDRRYVRLTLVPFFSQIGEVRTFTFDGSTETSTSTSATDDNTDGKNESNAAANTTRTSGTTVQLPTFQVISVSTTVSVPDGGTVLLGGIKRLREGRNEFGVPLLSKIAYIDRLFRNVAIGRETDSLMMMVTPHIIIQEEEEERLGVATE